MNKAVDVLMLFGSIFLLAYFITTLLCSISDQADAEKERQWIASHRVVVDNVVDDKDNKPN